MVVSDLPTIQYTPIEEIQSRVSTLRKTFAEHKTRDVEFRLVQLRKLYWAYVFSHLSYKGDLSVALR